MASGNKGTVNAFMRFAQEERPRIKAEHPNFTLAEISHELGVRYAALGAAERARRKDDARAEIARAHAAGGGNMANAVDFMDQVKVATSDEVYDEFLDALHAFKSKQIDVRSVILRVCKLLAGRRELILGFNAFLPPDYRIESHMLDANNHLKRGAFGRRSGSGHTPKLDVTDVDSAVDDDINNAAATSSTASTSSASPTRKSDSLKRASSNDNSVATDFVASVKSRLDSATFKQFLAAIGDFNDKRATREETLDRVNALLAGHTDLIRDFKLFLPKSRSNSKQHAEKPASLLSVPAAEKKSRRRSMEHKPSNSVTPTLRKAHAFLHRIETEFPSDQRVAEKFVSLVRGFQQQERSARDFFEKTSVLLTKASGQESDIVDELMLFFPSQMELLYTALDGPGPTPSPPAHRGRGATLRAPRTTSGEYDTRQRSPEARSRTLKAPKSRGSEEATVKRKDKEKPAVAENKEKEKEKESTPKKAVATATAAPAMSPVSAVPANMAKEKTLTRLESTRS